MVACPRFTPHTCSGLPDGVVDPAGKSAIIVVRPSSKVNVVGSLVVRVIYSPNGDGAGDGKLIAKGTHAPGMVTKTGVTVNVSA
jgi:hypothetical protein